MATKSEMSIEVVQEKLETGMERAREAVGGMDRRLRAFIVERPVAALACAVGLGYLAGRLIARR